MRISSAALIAILNIAGCLAATISREGLDRHNTHSEYLARTTMRNMFHDTIKYLWALNDYIQKIEHQKFRARAAKAYKLFEIRHAEFVSASKKLDSAFRTVEATYYAPEKVKAFEFALQELDREFTYATKAYTRAFRRVNRALTKLDQTKMMYTDAEIFKQYSAIEIRTQNYLVAMGKIIDIVEARADESEPLASQEEFFSKAMKRLRQLEEHTKSIYDGYPVSVLRQEEYDKMWEGFYTAKANYDHAIEALEMLHTGLAEKYQNAGIKFGDRFKKTIDLMSSLPFRISAFVTPSAAATLLLAVFVVLSS